MLLIKSKSVESEMPPWTTNTLLFTIVPNGNHRYTSSINLRRRSALCYFRKKNFVFYLEQIRICFTSFYLIFLMYLAYKSIPAKQNNEPLIIWATNNRIVNLAFITVSSWFPLFKYTPPGNTRRHDSSSNKTSKLFFPRSTKSPLNTYGFSGDGSPFWNNVLENHSFTLEI